MVFGWRAGVHRQGYALVCAKKVLDILVVVIDGMTNPSFLISPYLISPYKIGNNQAGTILSAEDDVCKKVSEGSTHAALCRPLTGA